MACVFSVSFLIRDDGVVSSFVVVCFFAYY